MRDNGDGGGAAEIRASEGFYSDHRWLVSLDYIPPAVLSLGDSAMIYY